MNKKRFLSLILSTGLVTPCISANDNLRSNCSKIDESKQKIQDDLSEDLFTSMFILKEKIDSVFEKMKELNEDCTNFKKKCEEISKCEDYNECTQEWIDTLGELRPKLEEYIKLTDNLISDVNPKIRLLQFFIDYLKNHGISNKAFEVQKSLNNFLHSIPRIYSAKFYAQDWLVYADKYESLNNETIDCICDYPNMKNSIERSKKGLSDWHLSILKACSNRDFAESIYNSNLWKPLANYEECENFEEYIASIGKEMRDRESELKNETCTLLKDEKDFINLCKKIAKEKKYEKYSQEWQDCTEKYEKKVKSYLEKLENFISESERLINLELSYVYHAKDNMSDNAIDDYRNDIIDSLDGLITLYQNRYYCQLWLEYKENHSKLNNKTIKSICAFPDIVDIGLKSRYNAYRWYSSLFTNG